jgi:hypothetical protein
MYHCPNRPPGHRERLTVEMTDLEHRQLAPDTSFHHGSKLMRSYERYVRDQEHPSCHLSAEGRISRYIYEAQGRISCLCRRIYQQHPRMRLSTIALSFIPTLLTLVLSSFHPPSGSLVLPSKIVTSSDGLQIFTESTGRKGAPAGKSHSSSLDFADGF